MKHAAAGPVVAGKWSPAFWVDLGERTGTTLIYGLVTMLTADASGAVSGNAQQWWLIVGLPAVLSVLKSVGANLKGAEPSASIVDVTSMGETLEPPAPTPGAPAT